MMKLYFAIVRHNPTNEVFFHQFETEALRQAFIEGIKLLGLDYTWATTELTN